MRPVSATADCCGTERSSGGRLKSLIFAAVMPHFIVGAQKKIVFGPAGWFQIPLADCDMLVLNAADDQQTTLGEKYSSVLTSNSEWRKIMGRGSYDPLQASKSKQQARQSLFFRDYSSPESGICPTRCTKVSVNTYLRITHLSHISHLNNI